jgi:hypothetical protein
MRTKQTILKQSLDEQGKAPIRSTSILAQEQLRLEVLVDIRDNLTAIKYACLGITEHFTNLS